MAYEHYTADPDHHDKRHSEPNRCTDESCTGHNFGFISQDTLGIHLKTRHSALSAQCEDCSASTGASTNHRTEEGGQQIPTAAHRTPARSPDGVCEEDLEYTPDSCQTSRSESEPRCPLDSLVKRSPSKNFRCEHCSKIFTRHYNLKSHLITHNRATPFSCNICKRAFARKSDAKRHMGTHSGEKNWVCKGCQTSFARRDMLSSHHKSQKGQACLRGQQRKRTLVDDLEKSQSPKMLSISSLLS